jgi:cytochrome b561
VHLSAPAVLLTVVYAAAVAVAVTAPGEHAVAGLLVLAGLVTRWAVRHRRAGVSPAPAAPAVDAVLAPDTAPARAAAA